MIIKARHLQHPSLKYCVPGTREFFKRHDICWRTFIKEGIDSQVILSTNDPMAIRLVKLIEETEGDS